jgi:hypothetical protein
MKMMEVPPPVRFVLTAVFLLTCLAALNAQEQSGTIVFYREPHAMTGDFKPTVYCDGEELARIENGTSFEVTATVGVHSCTAESLQRPGAIEVNVVAGKSAYVHVILLQGWTRHAALANTTEDEYDKQKSRLKPVKEWSRTTVGSDSAQASDSLPANKQAGGKPPRDKHVGKFGDLAVSVTKLVIRPAGNLQDRDELAAFVSVSNTGKGVICATLDATLNTTFALQYRGFTGGTQMSPNNGGYPPAPRMNEMLPDESAEGSYVFEIKHGVSPLEFVIKLASRRYIEGQTVGSIRCGSNNPLRDIFVPDEIRFDVSDFSVTDFQPAAK